MNNTISNPQRPSVNATGQPQAELGCPDIPDVRKLGVPEESKHASEKFEVVSKAGYPAVFGRGRVLCSPGGYSIAELRGDKSKAEEIVALAHLFAAAPELLAALERIAPLLNDIAEGIEVEGCAVREQLIEASAAIQKAKGGQ